MIVQCDKCLPGFSLICGVNQHSETAGVAFGFSCPEDLSCWESGSHPILARGNKVGKVFFLVPRDVLALLMSPGEFTFSALGCITSLGALIVSDWVLLGARAATDMSLVVYSTDVFQQILLNQLMMAY